MRTRGMALMTGLVFLAGISLLALTATSAMTLQRHQAANFQDNSRALAQADRADAIARKWLISRPNNSRQASCQENCVLPEGIQNAGNLPPTPEFEALSWWETHAHQTPSPEPAFWLMEEIHFEPFRLEFGTPVFEGVAYYRILSRGAGQLPGSVAITESIIARPWEGDFSVDSFPDGRGMNWFCGQFSETVPCGTVAWRQRR